MSDNLYNTCRFCKKANFETPKEVMLRYGVRHWAHVQCGIDRFGAEEFFRKLSPTQVNYLPWNIADTYRAELLAAHPTVMGIHREK